MDAEDWGNDRGMSVQWRWSLSIARGECLMGEGSPGYTRETVCPKTVKVINLTYFTQVNTLRTP